MLEATGGVNTHRGALWALGLLSAGAAAEGECHRRDRRCRRAGLRIPDPLLTAAPKCGLARRPRPRRRYRVAGAPGEAQQGFRMSLHAMPALAGRPPLRPRRIARLAALLALMAHTSTTPACYTAVAPAGLRPFKRGQAVTVAGGMRHPRRETTVLETGPALHCAADCRPVVPATCSPLRYSSTPSSAGANRHANPELSVPRQEVVNRPVHIGVVGSGDLEILLEPPGAQHPPDGASVRMRTSVDGFDTVWGEVLNDFSRTAGWPATGSSTTSAPPPASSHYGCVRQPKPPLQAESDDRHDRRIPLRPDMAATPRAAQLHRVRRPGTQHRPAGCGHAARARRSLRPARIPMAGAAGHHAAGRRWHRRRTRHRRRRARCHRRHRAGLPRWRHRRGLREPRSPGRSSSRPRISAPGSPQRR